jgi:hypothetical protein
MPPFLCEGGPNTARNKVTDCKNILLLVPIAKYIHKDMIFYTFPQQNFKRIATCYWLDGPASILGGGEIFCTRLFRTWGLPSFLYNGYRVSFPGIKRRGRGIDQPPSFSSECTERIELHLYSDSVPSW